MPFDVRDRSATLKPKLLLLRGVDDPAIAESTRKRSTRPCPRSRYVKLSGARGISAHRDSGQVNALIEEFVATL